MILLPNGCRCSEIKVTPSNWNKPGASTKERWYIYYRFYDPEFPKPHMEKIRDFNIVHELSERRAIVKELIAMEYKKLKDFQFNPITNQMVMPDEEQYEIDPETPFIEALNLVLPKLDIADGTRDDIKHVITGVTKAAKQLRYDHFSINKVSRKHIKILLEWCGNNNSKWSNNRFNAYRSYLAMLFSELVELDAVTANPIHDIKKKKNFKQLRVVLTEDQRKKVDNHLAEKVPRFHQFVHLFFHSGARGMELMKVQAKDVDLERQVYRTIVMKGGKREAERTIKDIAVPFWKFFLEGADPEEYLFSLDFKPGIKPMKSDVLSRWWMRHVKKDLKISADFYSLKHLNTADTVDVAGNIVAAAQNGHTSVAMVDKYYDIRKPERDHEVRRKVNNPFA